MGVFSLVCFNICSHYVLDVFFGSCFDHFGIDFSINFMTFLELLDNSFETSRSVYMYTVPTREHGFWYFSTLHSYDILIYVFCKCFRFAYFWGSILEAILARLGIYFWSFGCSKSDRNVIKKQCEQLHRTKYVPRTSRYEIDSRAGGQKG